MHACVVIKMVYRHYSKFWIHCLVISTVTLSTAALAVFGLLLDGDVKLRKKRCLQSDIDSITASADEYAEKAEQTHQVSWITKSSANNLTLRVAAFTNALESFCMNPKVKDCKIFPQET